MADNPKMTGTRYVLAVKNLHSSVDFYKNELGFETTWSGEGWHFLKRDKCNIMLGECPEDVSAFEINNHSYFAYVEVHQIDLLYKEYLTKNIEVLSEPVDRPWGQREFAIRTSDGHRIMFGEEISNIG